MADTSGANNFDLSRVVSRGFDSIGKNVAIFLGLSLILAGIPTFAFQIWLLQSLGNLETVDASIVFTWAYWGPILGALVVSTVANAVLQAALTRATVTHLSGDKPDFGKALGTGLSMILPVIVLGFIIAIACTIGLLLLIVPGVLLWLVWSVTVPAFVQERIGLFEAFGRSAKLTAGARGKIFLLFLAIVVGIWILSIPVSMISGAIGTANIFAFALIETIFGALGSAVMVTMQASTYVELREVKEGVGAAELESIFA